MILPSFHDRLSTSLVRAASASGLTHLLQRYPSLYRPMRAVLISLVGQEAVARQIVEGPLRGYRMVLGPYDRNAYLVNAHERPIVEVVQRFCVPGMHVLDVGAHLGYFTLLFSVIVGSRGRVYAVEPNPDNFRKLQTMLATNCRENVVAFQVAASDEDGDVEFVTESTGQMGHFVDSLPATSAESVVVVQAVRLDTFTRLHEIDRVDLIKMDVEGAEPKALRGMAALLARARPLIICEWHPAVAGADYEAVFGAVGYSCELLEPASSTDPFHVFARPIVIA